MYIEVYSGTMSDPYVHLDLSDINPWKWVQTRTMNRDAIRLGHSTREVTLLQSSK